MSIDRASIVARAILSVICTVGLGERARVEITRMLRDEFASVEHDAISETRLHHPEDE
jgi:hypothetical protein